MLGERRADVQPLAAPQWLLWRGGVRGIGVGACHHRGSCSQTAPFPARINCQWSGERIRIISARFAEPYERRRYHNENQT
jgi:hypothetical protein